MAFIGCPVVYIIDDTILNNVINIGKRLIPNNNPSGEPRSVIGPNPAPFSASKLLKNRMQQ